MAATSTCSAQQTPAPRPSASLVIINPRNEILLVHRNPRAKAYGGVHVFPGGNYDGKQDDSLLATAVRETFEETGLLLAEPKNSPVQACDQGLDEARLAIQSQTLPFRTFLREHQYRIDEDTFLPFTQWVTPVGPPRRFRTQFFATFLPPHSSDSPSGHKEKHVPTPDGGQEVVSARFIHAKDALAEFAAGKMSLFPPQFYLLSTLAEVLTGRDSTLSERDKIHALSKGAFGHMVVNPRFLPDNEQGHYVLTFEGDETHGGSKGRRHRILAKNGRPGKAFPIMIIQRNFDIFTDIETRAFPERAKL